MASKLPKNTPTCTDCRTDKFLKCDINWFQIGHCRRPGLILETAAPPPFLVRAMFLTGSSSHLIIFYISTFGSFLETLPMIILQTAPG